MARDGIEDGDFSGFYLAVLSRTWEICIWSGSYGGQTSGNECGKEIEV